MTDDNYKDMVIEHDKHIDMLAGSITSLSTSMDSSNSKLDTVIDALTHQNVIIERMNNMDVNISESFNRAWKRLDTLEDTTKNEGCEAAKLVKKDTEAIADKALSANKRIANLETAHSLIDTVSSGTVKWVSGLLLFYSIIFGTYVTSAIHDNDTALQAYIAKDSEARTSTVRQLDDIVSMMRDRDGRVITYTVPNSDSR